MIWAAGSLFTLAFAVYTLSLFTPWPGALLTRGLFTLDAWHTARVLEKYVPEDVTTLRNLHYDTDSGDTFMDLHYPSDVVGTERKLPTIVWVHGGGWLSGSKQDVAPYAKILASKGYTVAAVNYSLAPTARYPTPVRQVAGALSYLRDNAGQLPVDASAFVLAGDSAGAHIAAQLANAITAPAYAEALGFVPPVEPSQIAGVILYCGPYDLELVDIRRPFAWLIETVLWSYTGTRDIRNPELATLSVIDYITEAFPPAFISVGNGDPLEVQSRAFAAALSARGVVVETLFFPRDYSPALPHEYQFKLDSKAAISALNRSLDFLEKRVGRSRLSDHY